MNATRQLLTTPEIGCTECHILEQGDVLIAGAADCVSVKTIEVIVKSGKIDVLPGDHRRRAVVKGGEAFQSRGPIAIYAYNRALLVVRYLSV